MTKKTEIEGDSQVKLNDYLEFTHADFLIHQFDTQTEKQKALANFDNKGAQQGHRSASVISNFKK